MMHATNHSFAHQGFEGMTILPALAEPTLVDEANHRIANSLQLLSAMISIEARMLEDRGADAGGSRRRCGSGADPWPDRCDR
jgi:hypothetical protein